jgi:hypothetical protein
VQQQTTLTWPMTIIMCLSIAVFGGGVMVLLVLGRDVPGALWAIVGGLVNAIVSLGGFFNMRQMHAASLWHLAQATVPMSTAAQVTASFPTTMGTGEETHKS